MQKSAANIKIISLQYKYLQKHPCKCEILYVKYMSHFYVKIHILSALIRIILSNFVDNFTDN